MATDYTELQTEIQAELDNDNPNLVASIPNFIHRAERRFNRVLKTLEMECRASTDIRPVGTTDENLGVYAVPSDWHSHKTVEVRDEKLIVLYAREIPALSGTNPTNWLLDKADDLYLYGSLVFAEPYLKNDPRISTWAALADSAMQEVEKEDLDGRFGGGPHRTRIGTQHLFRGLQQGQSRYQYLAPYDFFDLEQSGRDIRTFGFRPGVFTVAERKIRILPKPKSAEAGTPDWTICP